METTKKAPRQKPTKPTKISKPAEILLKAADLIEEHGWVRGVLGNRFVGFCLLGSVVEAKRELGVGEDDKNRAQKALENVIPFSERPYIASWNDDRCKSKQQAIAKLKQAAKSLTSPKEV